ncbi:hypothetical protein SNF32_13800 [Enterococcus mundtii]|nr:hypothetical protein [Enterococcus mundtii]
MVYNYTTVIEKDKEVETVVITVDKETGEEHTEVKREKKMLLPSKSMSKQLVKCLTRILK